MKQIYLWGGLVGLFIFIEVIVGTQLDLFYDVGAKSYLYFIHFLTLGVGIYLGLRDYKHRNGGLISFGRCMFNGILISIATGLVVAIGSFIFFNYINPDETTTIIKESEVFLVHQKDTNSNSIAEYKKNFIKNYRDTVRTTESDIPAIEKMASDSASKIEKDLDDAKRFFSFGGQTITNVILYLFGGIIISVIVAAVMANKKA